MKRSVKGKISLQELIGLEKNNTLNEVGHQAAVSSQTLSAMEELKDELAFYLDPTKQYPGMSIDFEKIVQLSKDLIIAIKKYR